MPSPNQDVRAEANTANAIKFLEYLTTDQAHILSLRTNEFPAVPGVKLEPALARLGDFKTDPVNASSEYGQNNAEADTPTGPRRLEMTGARPWGRVPRCLMTIQGRVPNIIRRDGLLPTAARACSSAPGRRRASRAPPTRVHPTAVLTTYADIAHAAYQDSLTTARTLQAGGSTPARRSERGQPQAAKDAWKAARVPLNPLERGDRFGNPIVDDWEGRVNSWPLDEGLIDYVAAAYGTLNSAENKYYASRTRSPTHAHRRWQDAPRLDDRRQALALAAGGRRR